MMKRVEGKDSGVFMVIAVHHGVAPRRHRPLDRGAPHSRQLRSPSATDQRLLVARWRGRY